MSIISLYNVAILPHNALFNNIETATNINKYDDDKPPTFLKPLKVWKWVKR